MVEMVHVCDMPYGLKIDSHTYNAFCYADDISLLSDTPKGQQKLMEPPVISLDTLWVPSLVSPLCGIWKKK